MATDQHALAPRYHQHEQVGGVVGMRTVRWACVEVICQISKTFIPELASWHITMCCPATTLTNSCCSGVTTYTQGEIERISGAAGSCSKL